MRLIVRLLSVALLVSPAAAFATSYSAFGDFSITGNPNGVWSYGYGTPGSTFSLDTASGTNFSGAAWNYWSQDANDSIPIIANTNGNTCCSPNNTVASFTGALEMHPGDADNLASILVFTAPTTGMYNLSGYFEREDTSNGAGTGVTVSVYDNNTLLDTDYLTTIYGTTYNFGNSGLSLNAGDTISFDVARVGGTYVNDSTALSATITNTPEPSTLALLGTGLVGAAGLMRRRIRRA